MIKLDAIEESLWGQTVTIHPFKLSATFGENPTEPYWVQSLDDRPNFYLFDGQKDLEIIDYLDEIMNAIEEESLEFRTDEEWAEIDESGYIEESRRFPTPPAFPMGWQWGFYG